MASDPSPLDPQSAPSPAGGTRCGFVAVLGAPNVGKSTLVNRLVGSKVSIVSPKVQTTRTRVVGIALFGVSQVLLVDTPGLFEPRRRLDRAMIAAAWEGAAGADAVMLMIDAVRGPADSGERVGRWLRGQRLPSIAVLNKVDRAEKPQLLAHAAALQATEAFARIFMISALTGDGVDDLADYLAELVPTGPWLYPEDQVSDMPSRILAAEITREKLFWLLRQELPYAVAVETESWAEQRDGSLRLEQIVWVEREGQRAIILGRGGQQIKRIGAQAREEMSRIFERRVHLFLYVKVRAGWTDDPRFYHLHGLTVPPAR